MIQNIQNNLSDSNKPQITFMGGNKQIFDRLHPWATQKIQNQVTPNPMVAPMQGGELKPQGSSVDFAGGNQSIFNKIKNKLLGAISNPFSNKNIDINNTAIAATQQAPVSTPQPMAQPATPIQPKSDVFKQWDKDKEIKLAALLVAEGGNEGKQGMQAILNSIINRTTVNPSYYGNNVWDVITKANQYSGFSANDQNFVQTRDYLRGKTAGVMDSRKSQIELAKSVIEAAKSGQLNDITGGATHYWNPKIASKQPWMSKAERQKQIGNHMFGYLYK